MQTLGLVCAVAMPFFNIALIARIWRRKSSDDISLVWVTGVWICIAGMAPASLTSQDPVLKAFGTVNLVFFTGVLVAAFLFNTRVRAIIRKN